VTVSLSVRRISSNVESELKKVSKTAIPKSSARALNETAVNARSVTIKKVSADLKVPQKNIRKRFRADGTVRGDRIILRRAKRTNLTVSLDVGLRGILITEIAGAQTKRGVKAKGGRLYAGAFKQTVRGRSGFVLKRRGKSRRPMFAPRLGVRERLVKSFNQQITSGPAIERYKRAYERLLRLELDKINRGGA